MKRKHSSIFSDNIARLIAALLVFIASTFVPILFTIYTPLYDEKNTQADRGVIVSIVNQDYGLSPAIMTVYVLDNGNMYCIPSGFNPYVDSFDFQNKRTELSLRFDPKKERDNAYVIVSLSDDEEVFVSLESINKYERLSRILVWSLYTIVVIIIAFIYGHGKLFIVFKRYIRKKNKKNKK